MQLTQIPVRELAQLRAERQQAIDALRYYAQWDAHPLSGSLGQDSGQVAAEALVKLGEQP